jgi:hypothetical protein
MPPSSTNVIEDDDTSSPAISELDSDHFTHSGGDDDASSDSTPNTPTVTIPKSPLKRRQLADRISLGSGNIERTEYLKSRLLSNITAGGLVFRQVQLLDCFLVKFPASLSADYHG